MSKWVNRSVILLAPTLFILVLLLIQKRRHEQMYVAYERIVIGMDLSQVEKLLGRPGSPIDLEEVPQSPSGRVVKGDTYYRWTDDNDHRIVIAFVDGRVQNKWYWEPDL